MPIPFDILFDKELSTTLPTIIIFGEPTGPTGLSGTGAVLVDVFLYGQGEILPGGYGETTVSVSSIGDGYLIVKGNASTTVSVAVSGTAEFSSFPTIYGDSATTISVAVDGYGTRIIYGDSSVPISVTTTGLGIKEIYGDASASVTVSTSGNGLKQIDGSSSTSISVVLSGNGVWTGGPDIMGDSDITVSVIPIGVAAVLPIISGNSNTTVSITTNGSGTAGFVYYDISGNGSIFVEIESRADAAYTTNNRPFIIEQIDRQEKNIEFFAKVRVDIDNKIYEIRDIETNYHPLSEFRQSKWGSQLDVGWLEIESRTTSNNTTEFVSINTELDRRKYGPSELSIRINISTEYRFINNQVNISKLVDREFEKALIDVYSMYELEFE